MWAFRGYQYQAQAIFLVLSRLLSSVCIRATCLAEKKLLAMLLMVSKTYHSEELRSWTSQLLLPLGFLNTCCHLRHPSTSYNSRRLTVSWCSEIPWVDWKNIRSSGVCHARLPMFLENQLTATRLALVLIKFGSQNFGFKEISREMAHQ